MQKSRDNSAPLLEVKDLHIAFPRESAEPVRVVEGLSFSLKKGEVLGIVGESGCGKSLTAFSLLRILPPGAKILKGQVLFEGQDLLSLSEKKLNDIRGKKISMIFQEPSAYLNPVLTIGYQVAESYRAHNRSGRKEAMGKAVDILRQVRLPDPEKRIRNYPFELSGGQKQRIMTAIALVNEPEIIIADEPTTSLDVTVQAQIVALFKDLQKTRSSSIIFISHDLALVSEIADRILVMYAGTLFEEGDVSRVIRAPRHPYTKSLISSIPEETRGWKKMPTIRGSVPNPAEKPSGCPFHPRCEYAQADCSHRKPFLQEAEKGHFTACYHFEKIRD